MRLADEIDAIAGKRESAQREMERRIVAQMLTCLDDLSAPPPAAGREADPGAPDGDGDASGDAGEAEAETEALPPPRGHVVIIGAYRV